MSLRRGVSHNTGIGKGQYLRGVGRITGIDRIRGVEELYKPAGSPGVARK